MNHLLYASSFLDDEYFKYIFDNADEKPLQSIQKFNKLLINGIKDNVKKITIITAAPVNRKISKKIFIIKKAKKIDNVKFVYIPFINIKIIKQITIFFSTIIYCFFWFILHMFDKIVLIYDGFFPVISNICTIFSVIFRKKIIGLYTDLPKFMNHNLSKSSLFNKFSKFIVNIGDEFNLRLCNGYIFLTEQMNELINKKKKPYIIMEGLVDVNFKVKKRRNKENAILYAGGLYESYGVKLLIDSFIKWNKKDYKLWLFGEGSLKDYIKNLKNDNIVYFGSCPNIEVVKMEEKALLLVNPRFSDSEFTKYSFPSKNMEYMVSGTPLLTTKLPGMPKEYYNYVFLINEETIEGYVKMFNEIFSLSEKELVSFGKKAQNFVLNKKNNIYWGKKILDLTNKL